MSSGSGKQFEEQPSTPPWLPLLNATKSRLRSGSHLCIQRIIFLSDPISFNLKTDYNNNSHVLQDWFKPACHNCQYHQFVLFYLWCRNNFKSCRVSILKNSHSFFYLLIMLHSCYFSNVFDANKYLFGILGVMLYLWE